MSEERLEECPRCQHPLKSYPIQTRTLRFYDEMTFHLRCERCGWEYSTTARIDHFSRPDPELVEERPRLYLVTPDSEEVVVEDEKPVATPVSPVVQTSSRTAAPSSLPRQKRSKRVVPRWHWFAAAIVAVVPWILVVLVCFKPQGDSPDVQTVVSTESTVVVEPAIATAPVIVPSLKTTPPASRQELDQPKRRRPELPPEDNWPAPTPFDCDQFKTVAERLQCAGRPL